LQIDDELELGGLQDRQVGPEPQRARPTGPSGAGRAPAIRPVGGRCQKKSGFALGLFLQSVE
jgi:hypothetical protein